MMLYDDFKAELAHLDENLCRKDLTALERSQWLVRRKELYEAQHPETKAGVSQGEGKKRSLGKAELSAESAPSSFVADTVTKTGRSKRVVHEDVAIGTHLTPAAVEIIKGTPVEDHKTALMSVASKPPQEQVEAAKEAVDRVTHPKPRTEPKTAKRKRGSTTYAREYNRLHDGLIHTCRNLRRFSVFHPVVVAIREWLRDHPIMNADRARLTDAEGSGGSKGKSKPQLELDAALNEVRAWMRKWGHINSLAPICDAITMVVQGRI